MIAKTRSYHESDDERKTLIGLPETYFLAEYRSGVSGSTGVPRLSFSAISTFPACLFH